MKQTSMQFISFLLQISLILSSKHESCPGDCSGTARTRQAIARTKVGSIEIENKDWESIKNDLRRSCGLKIAYQTSHCFADYNHVDCCTIQESFQYQTNEDSLVPGMHPINQLGDHIVTYSIPETMFFNNIETTTTNININSNSKTGSWCTCQLNTPNDICHKQFQSETAFKLVWCPYDEEKTSIHGSTNDDDRNINSKTEVKINDYGYDDYDINSRETMGVDGKFGYSAKEAQYIETVKEEMYKNDANGYFIMVVDDNGDILNYGQPNNVPSSMKSQQIHNFKIINKSPVAEYKNKILRNCNRIARRFNAEYKQQRMTRRKREL